MRNYYKLIFYCFLILIISTIGITYWYISDHLLSDFSSIQFKSLVAIIIQITLLEGLIPTFSFLIIYFLIKKVKNKQLLAFLILILIVLVIAVVYRYVLYMIFHEFNNPILFK
ncbi:hypothetical protein AR687_17240 [Flavobacteriaceae bacterium CRH]|nr:hypothetical protein AR687_17240 [Flavobacteriaceae bacterium CRH]